MNNFTKKLIHFLVRMSVGIDNFIYKVITRLVVLDNDGIHPKHKILNYHQFFIDNLSPDDMVLDIGCGNGAVAFDVSDRAKEVVGIDISSNNILRAQSKYVKDNLKFINGDALDYNFDKQFDKIILSNVLEHIENRVDFLKGLHDVSKVILLRVPLIERDWLAVYKKNSSLEYRLDSTHFVEYTEAGLKEELKRAGWKIENYSIKFGEWWGVITSIKSDFDL